MKQKVLFIILNEYADWESAYLAPALRTGVMHDGQTPYEVKTVAPTLEPVVSLGGFRTIPDYSFDTLPNDYAAIVLIGGNKWDSQEAEPVEALVRNAIEKGRIVGAICNGASFLASKGFLNHVKHTGNELVELKKWGKENYTNEAGYVESQAVSDKNIVTANGTGCLEFTKELLKLFHSDDTERIDVSYKLMKQGFYKEEPDLKLDGFGIFVKDMPTMIRFYRDVLGFDIREDENDENVEMRKDGTVFMLYRRNDIEKMTNQQFNYAPGINGHYEIALVVKNYAEVECVYNDVLKKGATQVMPPTIEPWGQRTCYVADPEGNLIEIGSFRK